MLPNSLGVSVTLVIVGSALLASLITPVVRRLAISLGAVDIPDHRKIHSDPVPRLGGVAVALTVVIVVGTLLASRSDLRRLVEFELGLVAAIVIPIAILSIVAVGVLDDIHGLSARTKLLAELVAAGAVVATLAPLGLDLSPIITDLSFPFVGPALAILWIVAIANAVNMMDGVDGVAGGVSALAATFLAAMAFVLGQTMAALFLLIVSGAVIGFLPHNFRSKRIFLGDSGSLGLGFTLGVAGIVALRPDGMWLVLPALLVLALPLVEVGLTVLRRTLRALAVNRRADGLTERFVLSVGRPALFEPDRRHVPHRLLQLGLPQSGAVAALYAIAFAAGALAFATVRWPWLGPFGVLAAFAALVYFAPRWLYRELRILERGALLPLLETRLVRSRTLQGLYDIVALAITYVAAQALVQGGSFPMSGVGSLAAEAAIAATAGFSGFWLAGLYRVAYRHAGISEALRATRATLFGVALAESAVLVLLASPIYLSAALLFLFLALIAVVGARLSFRVLDHIHQQGRHADRRILLYGAGRGGDLAIRELLSNPTLGLEPVGFVDDDPQKWRRKFHGLTVHAGFELAELLRKLNVDDVVICAAKLGLFRRRSLTRVCRRAGVRVLSFDFSWNEIAVDPTSEAEVKGQASPASSAAEGHEVGNVTSEGALDRIISEDDSVRPHRPMVGP